MPRIAIDCRFASTDSGIGRYTRELVTRMVRDAQGTEYVLLVHSAVESWLAPLSPAGVHEVPYAHYSVGEQLSLPAVLSSLKADLLFTPHFNVPLLCPVPFVATIHDLILHAYPNQAGKAKTAAYRLLMRHAVKKARRIITVSEFVKGDIARTYGKHVAEKTVTIREGIGSAFVPLPAAVRTETLKKFSVTGPFFLYVGNAKQHKNVPMLLDAWRSASPDAELLLVCGGKEAEHLSLPKGARLLSSVSDAEMAALYSAAVSFVTPSLYEGFCLPIAEAQACGCPVIAVNRSAIPEVAGPSAILVEPTVDAVAAALRNPPASRDVVRVCEWDDAARQTAEALKNALS